MSKEIYIASDHAGFELKGQLKKYLEEKGFFVKDFGGLTYNPDDDYTDFVIPLAKEIAKDPSKIGIIIGGSGQGEAIAANRFKGVRAVVFNGQYKPSDGREVPEEIKLSREHNDANILSLGARFLSFDDTKEALDTWLAEPFSGLERHARRIKAIDEYGEKIQ